MPRDGMVISLGGVLERAAEAADASTSLGYGFMLRELTRRCSMSSVRNPIKDRRLAEAREAKRVATEINNGQ